VRGERISLQDQYSLQISGTPSWRAIREKLRLRAGLCAP
jgi:hypothetical protein